MGENVTEHLGGLVAVVTTGMEEYHAQLLRGIRSVLAPEGFSAITVSSVPCSRDPGHEAVPYTLDAVLREPGLAGVIVTTVAAAGEEVALLGLIAGLGLPVALVGVNSRGEPVVQADNVTGMRALMAHLLDECGVRRPALVRGLAHHPDAIEREAIFRAELAARGLPFPHDLAVHGDFYPDKAYRETAALLARGGRPDAVVAMNDLSAIGAMRAVVEAGFSVPGDVLVTGFDNERLAADTWPGVTTVDQDLTGQGAATARLLLARLRGEPVEPVVTVPSRLVVRGSTRGYPSEPERLDSALQMSEAAQERLSGQDAILAVNWAMLRCQTLAEVMATLAERGPQVGLGRCFVAIHERIFHGDPIRRTPGPGEPDTVRLVLDHRDGVAHPCPAEPFPLPRLLPEGLRGELASGALTMQPLTAAEHEFGYVMFEQLRGPVWVTELLHTDLSRTLEGVFSTRQLAEHAAGLEQMVGRRTQELERANAELQRLNADLRRSLMLDGLTRIANRTAFSQHLQTHWRAQLREGDELALLMIDVDLFKAYNDYYGHLSGDETLRELAALLQQSLREPSDLASRFGGEEFAVVLPRSGHTAAATVAERFRGLLADRAIPHVASSVAGTVTASIGIAVCRAAPDLDPREIIEAADRALYRAKALGRNQIAVAGTVAMEEPQARTAHAARPIGQPSW